MAQSLVVYYSRTGTTRRAARAIADAIGADLDEIVDRTPRAGLGGFMRSAVEATFRRPSKNVAATRHEPAGYDLIVLGTPVWNASLSSPLLTYVLMHRDQMKNVAYFCTCGGRGEERARAQLERLVERKVTPKLVLQEEEVARGNIADKVEHFADEIEDALRAFHDASAAMPAP